MSNPTQHHIEDIPLIGEGGPPISMSSVIDQSFCMVHPDQPLKEVIMLMGNRSSHCDESSVVPSNVSSSYVLVVSGEQLCGILTERDVVKITAQGGDTTVGTVADVMTRSLITLEETELQNPFSVLNIFQKHHIRHLPILDSCGAVMGVVTPESIRRTLQSTDLFRLRRVEEVMTSSVMTASPQASVQAIAQLMATQRVSCVVIAKQRKASTEEAFLMPMGIITERDIVYFQSLGLELDNTQAQSVMSAPLQCLSPEDNLWTAHQSMDALRVRRLVVSDAQGALVGLVTQTSILSALDPLEMQKTITFLQQKVDQLQDERIQWLKVRASNLETRVQSTEQRFQAIFNQTFQFIGLLKPNGILIEINQTALDFGGFVRGDVVNRPFWEMPFWDTSSNIQHQLQQNIARAAQGEFIRYEVDVIGIDRIATIDFSLRPMLDENGDVQLLIPEGRDITDRKQAEAAQRKSEQHFSNLADAAPVGIFQTDADGHCLYVNERWCEIAGMSPQQAMGDGWVQGLHPDDRQLVMSEWYRSLNASQPFCLEYRFGAPDRPEHWVFGQAVSELDGAGQITGYIGTITDISDRKQAENDLVKLNQSLEARVDRRTAELKISQEGYRLLCEKTPVMLHSVDNQGCLCRVSNFWLEHLGYTSEEVLGKRLSLFLTAESQKIEERDIFPNLLDTGGCFEVPYQVVKKSGEIIDVLMSATCDRDECGKPISLAVMIDVTQRNKIERALFREKELAQVTLHSIGDAVITTNSEGVVEYFNPVAEHLTGWEAEDAVGQPLAAVFHIMNEVTREPVENPVKRVLLDEKVTGLASHTILVSRDGTEICIAESVAPIRNRTQQMIGAVLVFHDVTQSRQLSRQLSWQASHDALTGLVNRRQFEQELSDTMLELSRESQGHVLCYLDLDQFKVVNDTCGHMAGDELLRQISQVLARLIRTIDVLARLGGDEFGILLKQCPLGRAEIIAENIRNAVDEFRFFWQENTFRIGVSIGLVTIDRESRSLDEVMSAADAACYMAKEGGRNQVHSYQVDDSDLVRQRSERRWSLRIKQALENNRFCLYQQPIVTALRGESTQVLHHEILLRMLDEHEELISPGAFIPAAERYSLMTEIDCWVVKTFFSHLYYESLQPNDVKSEAVSFINLSGASIGNAQFLAFLKEQFSVYSVPPAAIVFEITETAAIANLAEAHQFIQDLKQLGCRFALDDFGIGMSSFGYLKDLPVDFLKIDGDFVMNVSEDPADYAIVESINHIGHVLGLKTIAESVENYKIQTKMEEIGIDYLQGFGIMHPKLISLNSPT